jgi:hypothetical protein
MHGLTGGSWKRNQIGHGRGEERPTGNRMGHKRLRDLPPITVAAPALDPPGREGVVAQWAGTDPTGKCAWEFAENGVKRQSCPAAFGSVSRRVVRNRCAAVTRVAWWCQPSQVSCGIEGLRPRLRSSRADASGRHTRRSESLPAHALSAVSVYRREALPRTGLLTDRDRRDWRTLGSCRNAASSLFFSLRGSVAGTGRGAKRTPNASARIAPYLPNAVSTRLPLPSSMERGVGCPRATADGTPGVGNEMQGPAVFLPRDRVR